MLIVESAVGLLLLTLRLTLLVAILGLDTSAMVPTALTLRGGPAAACVFLLRFFCLAPAHR